MLVVYVNIIKNHLFRIKYELIIFRRINENNIIL